MFRALLTYPLILAVAFGPLLCCCTTGRVSAAPAPSPSPRTETPTQRLHACCAQKHQPTEKPTSPKPTPTSPGQPCPCKDGSDRVQAVGPTTAAPELTAHLRVVSLDLIQPASATGLHSLAGLGDPGIAWGSLLTFLSPSDLLFAQHRLRC